MQIRAWRGVTAPADGGSSSSVSTSYDGGTTFSSYTLTQYHKLYVQLGHKEGTVYRAFHKRSVHTGL